MTSIYGPVEHGLICGYLFRQGGQGVPIDLAHAKRWLEQPSDDGFVWLHFSLTDASAERWIQTNLPVPPEYFVALHEGSRSTRIEDAQDALIAVVNDVAYEFSFDPSQIASLWICVTSRMAISTRVQPLKSIDTLRRAVNDGAVFASSVALLNHLMHDQGDVLVRIVREATLKVDAIEDGLVHGRLKHQRSDLGQLRRVLVRLQRLLAPEPAALFRLLRQPPPWVQPHDLDEMRQATEEFSMVIRDMSALQERIKLLQEEMAARVGEQTNKTLFTLTMVTVLALPINIVTGFFGMNVGGVPLADSPYGFLTMVLIVVVFTGVAAWLAFRRRD